MNRQGPPEGGTEAFARHHVGPTDRPLLPDHDGRQDAGTRGESDNYPRLTVRETGDSGGCADSGIAPPLHCRYPATVILLFDQ